ncbi:uncharacterized protein V6R79_024642 [Siganus canaliculatus]
MMIDHSTEHHLSCPLSYLREDNSAKDMRKRKRESEDQEEPSKISRKTPSFSQAPSQLMFEDSNTAKTSGKRPLEDSEEGERIKRRKLSPSPEEECEEKRASGTERPISRSSKSSCLTDEKCCTLVPIVDLPRDGQNVVGSVTADEGGEQAECDRQLTDSSSDSSCCSDEDSCEGDDETTKVELETKYRKERKIGRGAYGLVAIKYIHWKKVTYTEYGAEGRIPLEVSLLQSLTDVAAVIRLLDWYDLGSKTVLVMERPEDCLDLFDYISYSENGLGEFSMKLIIQQLVDAFVEIHSAGVFHRDLHSQNILIDFSTTVPYVRIIDFGCGSFLKPGNNKEPTTVVQIGQVLYEMRQFSPDCDTAEDFEDFLSTCLNAKLSLQELQCHPWLCGRN